MHSIYALLKLSRFIGLGCWIVFFCLLLGKCTTDANAYTVYDPWNYRQNILTASRALEQIKNQVKELQNQARMLSSLGYDGTRDIQKIIEASHNLLNQTQGIAYDIGSVNAQFESLYPREYSNAGFEQFDTQRSAWMEETRAAQQNAMSIQAQVNENIPRTQEEVGALISRSNNAQGQTAAIQATNQLLVAVSSQISELQVLLISQTRAINTFIAEQNSEKAQAQAAASKARSGMSNYTPVSTNPFRNSY